MLDKVFNKKKTLQTHENIKLRIRNQAVKNFILAYTNLKDDNCLK